MIPITINGRKAEMPTNWQEVTISQFIAMDRQKDFLRRMAILLNLDYQTVARAKDIDISGVQQYLQFCLDPMPVIKAEMPASFEYDGRMIDTSRDMDLMCIGKSFLYGQLEAAHFSGLKEDDKLAEVDMTELIIPALAVFLQDDNTFDDEKHDDYLITASQLPCTIAWPLGFFFLKRFGVLSNVTTQDLRPTLRLRVIRYLRSRAVRLLTNLDLLTNLTNSRAVMYSNTKQHREYPGR